MTDKSRKALEELIAAYIEDRRNSGHDGNAPGHAHDVAGIWDADNVPEKRGTKCRWCAAWFAARAVLATAPAEPPKLRDAALAFLKKYDALEPVVDNMFFMEANRGRPYKGDTWEAEINALRSAAEQSNGAGAASVESLADVSAHGPMQAQSEPGGTRLNRFGQPSPSPAPPPHAAAERTLTEAELDIVDQNLLNRMGRKAAAEPEKHLSQAEQQMMTRALFKSATRVDASSRKDAIQAIARKWGLIQDDMIDISMAGAMSECWRAATEAAAKKCDALADGNAGIVGDYYKGVCTDCAAAIRGGKL